MIRRLIILFLLLSGYRQSELQILLQGEAHIYQVNLDGVWEIVDSPPSSPELSPPDLPDLPFKPLFPPLYSGFSNIWILTGESDPYSDLYRYTENTWQRLTDIANLFPDVSLPLLSAAVEAVSEQPDGLLYRAKIRDTKGTDFNELYFYHWETGESEKMPFFGKNPVWSSDGTQLVGSRYADPLYELWLVDLITGEETFLDYGCNPQWVGDWLAYDEHNNAVWQNYTDCFANGEVAMINMATGEKIALTKKIEPFVQLLTLVTD